MLIMLAMMGVTGDKATDDNQAIDCRKALAEALLLAYPSFDQSHVIDNSGKGLGDLGNFDNCVSNSNHTHYILASDKIERGGVECTHKQGERKSSTSGYLKG